MSGKKILIPLLFIGVAAGGFFLWRWQMGNKQKDANTYVPITANKGDLLLAVQATGTVQPENRVVIKPPINGRIDKILAKEGQAVKKGQILAQMSSTDRAALLDVARGKGPEEVRHWEEIYRPTPIIAPVSGVIITRSVEPGQAVSSNDAVYSMSDHLIINAQVDETDMAKVKLNQRVAVSLDAYPAEKIVGHVHQIAFDARTVNNVTVYDVQILPDKVPDFMRSGMTASVQFTLDERKDVTLIPEAAVIRENGGLFVLRKSVGADSPDQKPEKFPIKIGLTDGKSVEVVEGLAPGDEIFQQVFKLPDASTEGGSPFSPMRQRKNPGRGGVKH